MKGWNNNEQMNERTRVKEWMVDGWFGGWVECGNLLAWVGVYTRNVLQHYLSPCLSFINLFISLTLSPTSDLNSVR